jgi:hypothetical protein
MKKLIAVATILFLWGTGLFAQEGEQEAPALPINVNVGFGNLLINGRVIAGFQARQTDTPDSLINQHKDKDWHLRAVNPLMEENRAELAMTYTNKLMGQDYGAFVLLQAQNYGTGAYYSDYMTALHSLELQDIMEVRYALIYKNFFDGKLKASFGKLYDELYLPVWERVWKTEGPGYMFRFTDEKVLSTRLEFKPIDGLNVGAQFFFVNPDADFVESLKEVGLGAQYESDLFNAQAGVRFDGAADGLRKEQIGVWFPHYYGQKTFDDTGPTNDKIGSPFLASTWKHPIGDNFSDGTYAFFGFNFKGVKNLTAIAHGALHNLGNFNKYGWGSFSELLKYQITPELGAGAYFWQDFYGDDVLIDTLTNAPFFRFTPTVSYKVAGPVTATVEGTYGICPDVTDYYVEINPKINVALGGFFPLSVDILYKYTIEKYKDYDDPINTHIIGIGIDMMF